MAEESGLICAYLLDGQGGGKTLGWPEISTWSEGDGVLWVHLELEDHTAEQWLREESGLDALACDALLAGEMRPRASSHVGGSLLLNLRGVNLNPGADPEDMVGIRMWLSEKRVISVRRRRLLTINDLREALDTGRGPSNSGEFLTRVTGGLIERMGPAITDLDDRVDDLEDQVLTAQSAVLRTELSRIRKTAISLRRYLAPQREAMLRILTERPKWMDDRSNAKLREVSDTLIRYIEDLDAARERAAVTQEELNSMLADRMNRTMYVLTVVAAVMLPPSLIVGLFGINVGGMPGTEDGWAFYEVIALIVVLGLAEVYLLRKLKWI